MRFAICCHASVLAIALASGAFAQNQPAETIIRVDARKTANYTVPRTIFGTFLEPIGNSIYNGLWAEILQNPSFEDSLWDVKHVAEIVKDEPQLNRSSEMALPPPWNRSATLRVLAMLRSGTMPRILIDQYC
jgi:alpha-N-arabinofuranosidase